MQLKEILHFQWFGWKNDFAEASGFTINNYYSVSKWIVICILVKTNNKLGVSIKNWVDRCMLQVLISSKILSVNRFVCLSIEPRHLQSGHGPEPSFSLLPESGLKLFQASPGQLIFFGNLNRFSGFILLYNFNKEIHKTPSIKKSMIFHFHLNIHLRWDQNVECENCLYRQHINYKLNQIEFELDC